MTARIFATTDPPDKAVRQACRLLFIGEANILNYLIPASFGASSIRIAERSQVPGRFEKEMKILYAVFGLRQSNIILPESQREVGKQGKIMMNRTWLAAATALLFVALPLQAQVYQWVDEQGVKHFSNSPPPEGAIDVREYEEEKSSAEPEPSEEPRVESPTVSEPLNEEADAGGTDVEADRESGGSGEIETVGDTEEAGELEGQDNPDIGEENPESPTTTVTSQDELVEQERSRLEIRLTQLNRQLEEARNARGRGSSYDVGQWNEKIEQIESEIEKEKKLSESRIEKILNQPVQQP